MDNPRHYKPQLRRVPASCRFCRTRKLRCSRGAPCSNCVERDLPCDLPTIQARQLDQSDNHLLERIQKLEALLGQQQNKVGSTSDPALLTSSSAKLGMGNLAEYEALDHFQVHKASSETFNLNVNIDEHTRSAAQLEKAQEFDTTFQANEEAKSAGRDNSQGVLSPFETQQTASTSLRSLDDDVAHLERIYIGADVSSVHIQSQRIVFRICRMRDIPNSSAIEMGNNNGTRCIWLPEYHEVQSCLRKFIEDIGHTHHIYHIPSIPGIVEDIYLSINSRAHIKPGYMLLLLGILISSVHSWSQHDYEHSNLFENAEEAHRHTLIYLRCIENVLDVAHRDSSISIEGLQGLIIAGFVLCNLEGFSRRVRSWYSTSVLLARELGLHRIDHPRNNKFMTHKEAEIGRRVWWYVVSCEWMAETRFGGMAQGFYSCHVRHIMTRKPLNIDDDDLDSDHAPVEKPLSQPTVMSYYLHRLKLAEICLKLLDLAPIVMADVSSSSYAMILDVDTEIQRLLNDLPPYFSMSASDIARTYNLAPAQAARLNHHGYMIRQITHGQRCALHIPYLNRSYIDSTYASSRAICLATAKSVITTETAIENPSPHAVATGVKFWPAARYKFLGLVIVIFISSVILLIDQCQRDRFERTPELDAAIALLEAARAERPTAARFLVQLMDVLQKHKHRAAVTNINIITQQPQGNGILPTFAMSASSLITKDESSSGQQVFPVADLPNPTVTVSGATTSPPANIFLNDTLPVSTNSTSKDVMDIDISAYFDEFARTLQDTGSSGEAGGSGGVDWEGIFLELEGGIG